MDTLPWYRYPWPWFLLGIFVVTVISGIAMVVIAGFGADDVVVDNYYRRGLAINRELAEDNHADNLGLQASVSFSNQVLVRLNRPVEQVEVMLLSIRDSDRDRQWTLQPVTDFAHRLEGIRLPPGSYRVQIRGVAEGKPWRLQGRLRFGGGEVTRLYR